MNKTLIIDARMYGQSGIGRYLKSLLPLLSRRNAVNIQLLVAQYNDSFPQCYEQKISTFSNIYSICEQIELPLKASSKDSLLWIPHYNIPIFHRGKILATVHDLAHLALPHLFNGIHKQTYAKVMFNALKYKAEQLICVSEFTKHELVKYTGIDESKINVIYNGIEEEWFHIPHGKNPEQHPYFLYVGNIKPHKNLKTLVKAFLAIRGEIPHNLLLVGKKEGFITEDNQISSLISKAPERINFTGFISDELLKQYYLHADAFVFPSIYEGFGYPPLEAMACGCPVIASNAASIPEICGNAAEYFSPLEVDELVEKLKEVLISDTLKRELIQKGKKQVKKFPVLKTVDHTSKIVSRILKE